MKWAVAVIILFASLRIEENMTEAATRKGTREKKPSRFHHYEDPDFTGAVVHKNGDQRVPSSAAKDRLSNAQELNQLARLFCRFISTSNARYHELADSALNCPAENGGEQLPEGEGPVAAGGRKNEGRNGREEPRGARGREGVEGSADQRKGWESKGKNKNGKQVPGMAPSLETDLSYHHALNQHVKNAYPNINTLSADMLRELSIPTEMLQKQGRKGKEEKKSSRSGKEETKPFKRQSYHVAIAYHIHLKQVRESRPAEYVDPTYAARKLREQAQKDPGT